MTGPGITTLNAQGKLRRDEVRYVHRGRLGSQSRDEARGEWPWDLRIAESPPPPSRLSSSGKWQLRATRPVVALHT